jgi:hypothetical protein
MNVAAVVVVLSGVDRIKEATVIGRGKVEAFGGHGRW